MNRTHKSIPVSFEKMAHFEEEAIIFVKLSMVLNDLSQANNYLAKANDTVDNDVKLGEKMYFIRSQLAIISEALPILEEIRGNDLLNSILKKCTTESRDDFNELVLLKNNKNFTNRFTKSRSNVTYHYNKTNKLLRKAIQFKSKNRNHKFSNALFPKYSLEQFRLVYADEIVDHIICSDCWELEIDKNIVINANEIAVECAEICEKYYKFGYEFVYRTIYELFT